jgi:hypothetical protein
MGHKNMVKSMDRYACAYDKTKIIPVVFFPDREHTQLPSPWTNLEACCKGHYIIMQIFGIFGNKFLYAN